MGQALCLQERQEGLVLFLGRPAAAAATLPAQGLSRAERPQQQARASMPEMDASKEVVMSETTLSYRSSL